jgi:hypothetical protein
MRSCSRTSSNSGTSSVARSIVNRARPRQGAARRVCEDRSENGAYAPAVDVTVIRSGLGHVSLDTTNHYAQAAGAGAELMEKFRAAHSSVALAVNALGPLRHDGCPFDLGRHRGLQVVGFEDIPDRTLASHATTP